MKNALPLSALAFFSFLWILFPATQVWAQYNANSCSFPHNIYSPNVVYSGTTSGGSFPVSLPNCGGARSINSGDVAWFRIIGTGGPMQFETVPRSTKQFDTQIWVFTGCRSGCITGDDDSGGGTLSKVCFNSIAGLPYYVAVGGFNAASGNFALSYTTLPLTPTTIGDTRCGTGTLTFRATPHYGGSIDWYNSSSGGTRLGQGTTISRFAFGQGTPDTLRIYAEEKVGGCIAGKIAGNNNTGRSVAAGIVYPDPGTTTPTPQVSSDSVCTEGTVTLNVLNPITATLIYRWYGSATGGSPLATDTVYSKFITQTTNYYVAARNLFGCESETRGIGVGKVNLPPNPPTGVNDSLCEPGNATLVATGGSPNGGDLLWFDGTSNTAALVFTGMTYSPPLTATTNYYVAQKDAVTGCRSARSTVTGVLITPPNAPNTISDTLCDPGIASLAVFGQGTKFSWYDAPSGSTPIFTGAVYQPNLSQTTPYWVTTSIGPCESERTPIEGRVYLVAPQPQAFGDESCGPDSLLLRMKGDGGVFRWYDTDSAGNLLFTGDTLARRFTQTQRYWIEEVSFATTMFKDDFDANLNTDIWAWVTGTRSPICGPSSGQGKSLYFNLGTSIPRVAVSKPLDLRQGGIITFELKYGSNTAPSNCGDLISGNEVVLEYSVNSGQSYVVLNTYLDDGTYDKFSTVSEKIPPLAQKAKVLIRLRQLGSRGSGFDTWQVDNFGVDVTILSECPTDRVTALARIKAVPNLPLPVTGDTLCGPGQARLTAGNSGGSLEWYDAAVGGTMIATGGVYQPNVLASTPFWVQQVDTNGCSSDRISSGVEVRPVPIAPFTVGDELCGSDLADLQAISAGGNLSWYDDPTAGLLVATGASYNPFLVNSATFWVEEELDDCIGPRSSVTATIYPVPTTPAPLRVDTICGPGPASFEVAGSGGLVIWMDDSVSGQRITLGPTLDSVMQVTSTFWATEASLRPAEEIPLPAQNQVNSSGTQGYWFVAPTDMVLEGLRVPLDASQSGKQSVSIVRIQVAPSTVPTTQFEVLAYFPNIDDTGLITDSLPLQAGDRIGILGLRGGQNSVTAQNTLDTLMGVFPISLFPLRTGANLANSLPDSLTSDFNGLGLGRVQVFAHPVCFSGRKKIVGVVTPIPPAPIVIGDTTCGPDTVTLTATGTTGVLRWFDADSAGNRVNTGPAFRPFVATTTSYWVEELRDNCIGPRSKVTAIVHPIPDPPVTTTDTLCGPGSATLTATAGLGRVTWYDADSAGNIVYVGRLFLTNNLLATTTFWVTFTDTTTGCESPRDSVTVIVYDIPDPPIAPGIQVCGPDTARFKATGGGGILLWYDVPLGGIPLDTGETFIRFLERDKNYWVEELRNGCFGPRTEVEGLVNIVPDPPMVFDQWICDEGVAQLTAFSSGRRVQWYDADSAGNLLQTGRDYTVYVTDTTTLYVQIAAATIEKLGPRDSSLGGGAMSTFLDDGLTFDVLNPTTLKEVTVYPQDSGLLQVRLLNRFGEVLRTAQFDIAGPGEYPLLLDFPVLPGTGYRLDARGSTISGLYRSFEGVSFPYQGANMIITGTLNQKPDLYYFFYNWETGNCESERAQVQAISYPKPTRTATYPSEPESYSATYECVDEDGWTNYYHDLGTEETDDDLLLLAILKNNQDIGTVGDGTFRVRVQASDNAAGGGGVATQIQAPYVTNVDGWWVMNRFWEVLPNPAPTRPVKVRFFYNNEDLDELNNALLISGDSSGVTHENLSFYVIENGDPSPDRGHSGVGFSDYSQYNNGTESSGGVWVYGSKPPFNYGEFETLTLNGGGAGNGGGEDKGALTTGSLTLTASGSNVILDWKALSGLTGDYFEVEKSLDKEVFSKIGTVLFNNDSVRVVDYTFTDLTPLETRIYYRVKFVFEDSSFLYTNIAQIDFVKAADGLAKAYPNPTTGRFNFEFTNIIGSVTLTMVSMDGKIVLEKTWYEGDDLLQWVALRDFATGIYFYRLRFSNGTTTGKVLKIH